VEGDGNVEDDGGDEAVLVGLNQNVKAGVDKAEVS